MSLDISSITERSCWYLVWLAGSREPFCPIMGGKVMDMGVVGVDGAGGRDGVFDCRCCVLEGVLDLHGDDMMMLDLHDDQHVVKMMTAGLTCWHCRSPYRQHW